MNNEYHPFILTFVIFLIMVSIGGWCSYQHSKKLERGCECGGQYELQDVELVDGFYRHYFYQCDRCGEIFDSIAHK